MKKILLMLMLVVAAGSIKSYAQTNLPATQEEMLDRSRKIYKAPIIEKAKLSDAKAEQVVLIIAEAQMKFRKVSADQSTSADDRMKQMMEIRTERDKKFKAIPLTDEEFKLVNDAIDEVRRNMQNKN